MYSYIPPNENPFLKGDKIEVLEIGQTLVEEGVVIDSGYNELTIRTPDKRTESFVYTAGWRHLFEDPIAGGRCFSQNAPPITLRAQKD